MKREISKQPLTATRLIGSAVLAVVVVFGMLLIGLKISGALDRSTDRRVFQRLDLLSEEQNAQLARLLGQDKRRLPARPEIGDIPRIELQRRDLSGFVQLEVTVAPDGRVSDVEVLGATPSGYYEEEAKRQVLQKRYAPIPENAPIRQQVEIIEFTVPADER